MNNPQLIHANADDMVRIEATHGLNCRAITMRGHQWIAHRHKAERLQKRIDDLTAAPPGMLSYPELRRRLVEVEAENTSLQAVASDKNDTAKRADAWRNACLYWWREYNRLVTGKPCAPPTDEESQEALAILETLEARATAAEADAAALRRRAEDRSRGSAYWCNQMTRAEVERLRAELQDARDYVIEEANRYQAEVERLRAEVERLREKIAKAATP